MARKSFTTYTDKLRQNYEERDVDLSLTNGRANLSLGLRPIGEYSGAYVNLTPDQARHLAAELIERADEIEANPLPEGVL